MGVCALITVVLYFLTFVQAFDVGSSLESRELGLADIPACGIVCMLSKVPATGCALDDLDCVCNNKDLGHTLAACMLANCTMTDTQATVRVQADLCNLSDKSKRKDVYIYTGISYSIAFISVTMRVAGKLVSKRLALDDYIVVVAFLLTGVPLGCIISMTKSGFGEHLWNLQEGKLLRILLNFYISWSTYIVILGMIKVSLILFYLQIFKTRRFAMIAKVVLGYIVINSAIIFLMTIFICTPVDSFWNRDIKGKCMNQEALALANSGSAILQDLILLILPMVFIKNLQMKRYRKIAVGFMFSIGSFGCIATIVRLHTLLIFKVSIDPTWDYVPVTVWTELELAASFACVSLPSIRVLLVRVMPTRVKEMFSHITHPSSKDSSAQKQQKPLPPLPPPSRQWKKPSSWINITLDVDENKTTAESRKGFMRGFLPGHSVPSPFSSHSRDGSRRLHSAMSNYSESGVASTRPPYREPSESKDQPIELSPVLTSPAEKLAHLSKKSSESSEDITALPKIGCLPERNFSDLDLTRHGRKPERKWSRDERHSMGSWV
ncbi:hypothetical protein BKA66DRAFT_426625 [Pyrenochaeta sp. MPI-SDFR-AT-0127]|nr:hypothetical protein BKA66DRAFT_426625 [Pyrenochaeta sp. MPI-SDFR-AT-0127]